MILGRLAVGIIIFAAVVSLMASVISALNDTSAVDMSGWIALVIIVIALYCSISATYLLHLAGKV